MFRDVIVYDRAIFMMSEGLQTKRMLNAGKPSIKLIARLIAFIAQKIVKEKMKARVFYRKYIA